MYDVERPEMPDDLRHIADDVSQSILECIFNSKITSEQHSGEHDIMLPLKLNAMKTYIITILNFSSEILRVEFQVAK